MLFFQNIPTNPIMSHFRSLLRTNLITRSPPVLHLAAPVSQKSGFEIRKTWLSFRNWMSCVFNTFINLPSGAPKDSLLLSALKTLFRLSRDLLDLYEYILIGAIKFISVRPSSGNLSLLVRNYKGFSYCIIFPKILDAI